MYEGFWKTLKETKKYKDLFKSGEAKVASIAALVTTIFVVMVYICVDIDTLNQLIRDATGLLIAGILGLLGIVISGLTFTAGSMNIKITHKLVEQNTIKHLITIFFSFKFIGAIMGLELLVLVLIYLSSYIDFLIAYWWAVIIVSYLSCFLFWFSVFYCIGLLGTCINIFLLNYQLGDKNETNK